MTTIGSESPIVGVGGVVISGEDLLLVQRGNEPGKGLWVVPGGKVEQGETMREAVRREVFEETGLEVAVGEVAWIGEVIADTHHFVLIDFYAEVVGGELVASDDAADVRWVPLRNAADYPLTPTMYDLLEVLAP